MANRTPGRWAYRAERAIRRRRVIAADAPRGVMALAERAPRLHITRLQARLALAAAFVLLVGSAGWWAYHSPFLTVSEVRISGASGVPPSDIRAAANIDGDSVFGLDLQGAERRVAALPMVRSAHVTKHGYNGVAITIEERTVWGSWQMNGVNVPIDVDGYVMSGTAPAGSPVIIEVTPQRVLNAGDRLDGGTIAVADRLMKEARADFGRRVAPLAYSQSAGLTAVLASDEIEGPDVWVTFGDSRDYDYKVAALYALLDRAKQEAWTLRSVDLRFGDRLSFNQETGGRP